MCDVGCIVFVAEDTSCNSDKKLQLQRIHAKLSHELHFRSSQCSTTSCWSARTCTSTDWCAIFGIWSLIYGLQSLISISLISINRQCLIFNLCSLNFNNFLWSLIFDLSQTEEKSTGITFAAIKKIVEAVPKRIEDELAVREKGRGLKGAESKRGGASFRKCFKFCSSARSMLDLV